MLVGRIPEVKGSDGTEQQQRGADGERGHANLQ